jgi:ubiquinone/menaquinone biosynthesis C-methylase UbiE
MHMWVIWLLALAALVFLLVRLEGRLHAAPMPAGLEELFLANPLRRRFFGPELAAALLAPAEGTRVGEVGSGVGMVTLALARAVGPSGRVEAVDRQPEAVRRARARVARAGFRQVTVEVGDARALPWEDASLEGLVMVAMLGEVPRRVLHPGGVLVVLEYWPDPHFIPMRALRPLLEEAEFRITKEVRAPLQYGVRAEARFLDGQGQGG